MLEALNLVSEAHHSMVDIWDQYKLLIDFSLLEFLHK